MGIDLEYFFYLGIIVLTEKLYHLIIQNYFLRNLLCSVHGTNTRHCRGSKNTLRTLSCVAQLVGPYSTKWKSADSIPGQGTYLSGSSVLRRGTYKRQPIHVSLSHRCFSPSFSPSLPLSLKINKIFKKCIWKGQILNARRLPRVVKKLLQRK